MGFLDDLKRQAEAAHARQQTDTAALERNTALAEAACKAAFTYLDTLVRQLVVLKPVSKARYTLDRRTVVEGAALTDIKIDARRKMLRGAELYDHIALHARLRNGQRLALHKDFLPDIEKLEARLRQSGATVDAQAVRNPDNNKLTEMRYELAVDFVLGVRVTPDHDQGRLHFQMVNLDGLETVTADFAAIQVSAARLDDLARWILGEPHAFLDDAANLRRIEP